MKIITSGSKYTDIDVYAGCIAYAELLQKQGQLAQAVVTAPYNKSIPAIVQKWPVSITTEYAPLTADTYTLIDVSNPEYFEKFVDLDRIDKVIDHHPGFEEYWRQRIGDNAMIEPLGAACTQVFECWQAAGLTGQMSRASAGLLMCGILDNTLNFSAKITTTRDHTAYEVLSRIADLSSDWPAHYFGACQDEIIADIAQTVVDDTKVLDFKTYPRTVALGQFAVWDAGRAAHTAFQTFKKTLAGVQPDWCMNVIGIRDNNSYLVTDVPEVQLWLSDLLQVHFENNVAVADHAWLRKEIMQADIAHATQP